VARRLQERERELEAERERERAEREREREREREKEKEAGSSRHTKSPKRTRERELPPGLTPLLKRHKDLDDELQSRLAELERKVSVPGLRSRSSSLVLGFLELQC
jgi:kinesin family protein 22